MNKASSATGWVRNPNMKSPDLDPHLASSYELGWTLNPITGCLNRTPEGLCLGGMFPCYAFKLANGRLKERYCFNLNLTPSAKGEYKDTRGAPGTFKRWLSGDYADPFYPRFWPSRVEDLLRGGAEKPKGIFVCDMGELFGDWIPIAWQEAIFHAIRCRPWHRFYLLTKQPQNLIKWSPFPDNCWVGVTITNQASLLKATTNLGYIEAKVKYISFEPLLERLPLPYYQMNCDWVIIGAQTKTTVYPHYKWVQEIVSAADHAGIPVFLKDNLGPLAGDPRHHFNLYNHFEPMNPVLRQEIPE